MERLQKILSQAGVASRRAAEQLMIDGRVTVNGKAVTELGTKADPAVDTIKVDGRRLKVPERHRYILLHKPRGYVTTRSDPQRRPTVIDLLKGVRDYIYPVGRLDFDSEGLLLLTNDGDLAAKLTHPSHGVARVYEADVLGVPDAHDMERLSRGVTIDGRRTQPAQLELVTGKDDAHARVRITIREGRNRQVRNMFDAVGHPVDRLKRVAIGSLKDTRLKPGYWRDLTPEEVAGLKRSASRPDREARSSDGAQDRPERSRRAASAGPKAKGQRSSR